MKAKVILSVSTPHGHTDGVDLYLYSFLTPALVGVTDTITHRPIYPGEGAPVIIE